jgi:RNA polymerase sigma-70 factor (ECF subfamily)
MISPSLIAAARDGDATDVDRLIEAAWPHAFRIALSLLRDRALAEDAAQEACAIVFRGIVRLRSIEAFGVWFYRIVLREAMVLERRSRPSRLIGDFTRRLGTDDAIIRIDVLDALARLAPVQRATVVLHYYERMNSREIAAILDMPDSSVRFHIMNARKHLERMLEDHRERTIAYWEVPHLAT